LKRRDSKHGAARALSIFLLSFSLGLIWAASAFPTSAMAGEPPEEPITEACSGPFIPGQLCGTLNPGSSAKVGYYFEVEEGSSCTGGTHFTDGSEPEGESIPVSTTVSALTPSTQYTYCLVATNSIGETAGQGLTFVTPSPPSGPPTINSESVTNVTEHNATLNAEINPNGLLTKYKLQIDTTGNFNFYQADSCPLHPPGVSCAQVIVPGEPLPPGLVEPSESTLPAGTEAKSVSVDLANIGAILQPNTTYHYRAIAANGTPVVAGEDLIFTTPAEPPPFPTSPVLPPPSALAPACTLSNGLACAGGPGQPKPLVCNKRQVKRHGRCVKRRHHTKKRHRGRRATGGVLTGLGRDQS
jgi:hypothetical protein